MKRLLLEEKLSAKQTDEVEIVLHNTSSVAAFAAPPSAWGAKHP